MADYLAEKLVDMTGAQMEIGRVEKTDEKMGVRMVGLMDT